MEQDKVKRRFLFIAGPVTLFLILVGFTYAFFNYTRTGSANNIRTGNIYFSSDQNNTLNLTNVFPMKSSEAANANLSSVSVDIKGDTTYVDGEEFEVTLTGLNNTINGKEIPINYIAEYVPKTNKVIGSSSNDYWNARESKNANIYLLNTTGQVEDGKQVLVGYIDNEGNEIEGTLTIKAYIDADRIAISDTYYGNTPTPNPSASPTATPVNSTPTPGPSDEYGTTDDWVDGRVVLTTEEWNSLSSNPISFKIKAVSQEGIWAEKPIRRIESCPDCKFMYRLVYLNDDTTSNYTTWNTGNYTPTQITTGLYDNYEELIELTGKNYFLGVILNNNNEVTNTYVCGVKDDVPFCLEGANDESRYIPNRTVLQGADLYNNTCRFEEEAWTVCGPWDDSGSLSVYAYTNGSLDIGVGDYSFCSVNQYGFFGCFEPDSYN